MNIIGFSNLNHQRISITNYYLYLIGLSNNNAITPI